MRWVIRLFHRSHFIGGGFFKGCCGYHLKSAAFKVRLSFQSFPHYSKHTLFSFALFWWLEKSHECLPREEVIVKVYGYFAWDRCGITRNPVCQWILYSRLTSFWQSDLFTLTSRSLLHSRRTLNPSVGNSLNHEAVCSRLVFVRLWDHEFQLRTGPHELPH